MSIIHKKYDLFPDSIIIRDFKGEVNVSDIISSWDSLINNNQVTNTIIGVINNLYDCELQMDIDSFHKLMEYMKNQDCLKKIKLAVVCNDPNAIIFPVLAEVEVRELKIRPFSTIEASIDWILNG